MEYGIWVMDALIWDVTKVKDLMAGCNLLERCYLEEGEIVLLFSVRELTCHNAENKLAKSADKFSIFWISRNS